MWVIRMVILGFLVGSKCFRVVLMKMVANCQPCDTKAKPIDYLLVAKTVE